MLHPTSRAKEHIMLYGPYGAGKTPAWASIAVLARRTESSAQFHVLDSDNTYDVLIDTFGEEFIENTSWHQYWDWQDVRTGMQKFGYDYKTKEWNATGEDWLIVDRSDASWEEVQTYFTEQVWGQSAGDFFLQYKIEQEAMNKELAKRGEKEKDGGSPLAGAHGTNWDIIKKVYRDDFMAPLNRYPGHVLICCHPKALDGTEDPTVMRDFSKLGSKPGGEKNTPKYFHSILFMQRGGQVTKLSTARDRNGKREYLKGREIGDFAIDYLVGVAGWEL